MSELSHPAARHGAGVPQEAYVALLPKIRRVVRGYLRDVPCADRRDDLIQEAVALGWLWFLRLAARQKDPAGFATVFAYILARAVNSGRRLCGQERAKDVLSPVCRRRRGFVVAPLPAGSAMIGTVFDDALRDNTQTPVGDQVQFRLDFGRWRGALPRGKRRVLDALAVGERTSDAAARFGVSPGRVSQVRRELRDGWLAFIGDDSDEPHDPTRR